VTASDTGLSPNDERLLQELLAASDDGLEETRFNYRAFREMLERQRPLSEKQRTWLRGVHEKITGTPHYENMVSAGTVPRGREVASMVGALPKKPPQRRGTP
jgi:hypothetical protein